MPMHDMSCGGSDACGRARSATRLMCSASEPLKICCLWLGVSLSSTCSGGGANQIGLPFSSKRVPRVRACSGYRSAQLNRHRAEPCSTSDAAAQGTEAGEEREPARVIERHRSAACAHELMVNLRAHGGYLQLASLPDWPPWYAKLLLDVRDDSVPYQIVTCWTCR